MAIMGAGEIELKQNEIKHSRNESATGANTQNIKNSSIIIQSNQNK